MTQEQHDKLWATVKLLESIVSNVRQQLNEVQACVELKALALDLSEDSHLVAEQLEVVEVED